MELIMTIERSVGKMADQRQKCTMCDEANRDPSCYWCSGTGYETRSQDAPVCPHCGAQLSTDELHQTTDLQCDECDGWMECEVNYTVDFTTSKTEPPEEKRRKQQEEYERWKAAHDSQPDPASRG